jgi:hypothetical protein
MHPRGESSLESSRSNPFSNVYLDCPFLQFRSAPRSVLSSSSSTRGSGARSTPRAITHVARRRNRARQRQRYHVGSLALAKPADNELSTLGKVLTVVSIAPRVTILVYLFFVALRAVNDDLARSATAALVRTTRKRTMSARRSSQTHRVPRSRTCRWRRASRSRALTHERQRPLQWRRRERRGACTSTCEYVWAGTVMMIGCSHSPQWRSDGFLLSCVYVRPL